LIRKAGDGEGAYQFARRKKVCGLLTAVASSAVGAPRTVAARAKTAPRRLENRIVRNW
jgi:hypothetical protein